MIVQKIPNHMGTVSHPIVDLFLRFELQADRKIKKKKKENKSTKL